MKMKHLNTIRRLVLAGLCGSIMMSGCDQAQEISEPPLGTTSQQLWASLDAAPWPNNRIPTCFLAGHFSDSQRTAIRLAAEDSWERVARIEFDGWLTCPSPLPSGNMVVIFINPNLPVTPTGQVAGRSNVNGKASGLNTLEFLSGDPTPGVVIHEFGHVLGFIHETADDSCAQRTAGGISLEGQADSALSIMDFNTICNNNADALSSWDIIGVRSKYGFKPKGSIVGVGGESLNVNRGSTDFGAAIIGWPAVGSANEVWTRTGTLLRATFNGVNRCINVPHGTVTPGFSPLISWDCGENFSNEQFHFTGVDWRAMGDRCVTAEFPVVPGAKLSLDGCFGFARQKWDFFENDPTRIHLNGTGLCVSVPGAGTALGTEVTLANCSANPTDIAQSFTFTNNEIGFRGRCLNVLRGTTAAGSRIGLWDGCGGVVQNEKFTIKGPIHALGQCVNLEGGVPFNGVRIGMFPCQNPIPPTANEQWEFYW